MSERNFTLSIPAQPLTRLSEFDPEDEYRPEPEPEALPPVWLDGSVRIGIHTSIAGGHRNALETARKLGCNALQIFSANPRQWQGGSARIPEVDAQEFRALRAASGLGPLVIHANYLINLASPQPMLRVRSIQAFHDELVRGIALGADFIVVHPGTRGEATCAQAVATVIESLKQASKRAPLGGLRILLENTAGMGTCLSSRLEEMAEVLAGLNGLPIDVCLDTAHLFASGYDIRSEEGLASTIGQIENTIGLERVPVMHINDSKIPLGGRVDRHEHIGKGKIGAEAFRRILTHPRLSAMPPEGVAGRAFILETPIDDPGDDRKNVAALWELAGLKESAPAAEKGFSMMTASLKKKMDVQRAFEKKKAAAVERKRVADGGVTGQSESRSLRSVGMTLVAGGATGAKIIPIVTRTKRQADVTAVRKNAGDGGSIEERSLHSAARLLRRSEAEKKKLRAVPVGMTRFAHGASRAKIKSARASAAAKKNSATAGGMRKSAVAKTAGAKNRGAGKKKTAKKSGAAKRASGAKRRR